MWQERALEILKENDRPMSAREISEIIKPCDSIELQAGARSKASKALNKLKEYNMVCIVGKGEEYPHPKLWKLVEEE